MAMMAGDDQMGEVVVEEGTLEHVIIEGKKNIENGPINLLQAMLC